MALSTPPAVDADNDPFDFLERSDDPRTIAWTAEQNAATRAYFASADNRAGLIRRFDQLSGFGTLGVPIERGERLFYAARRGRAEQATLFVRDARGERILVDPSAGETGVPRALDWWYPSPNGTYVAYGLSENGDEHSVLRVRRADDGTDLFENIPWTRHCSLAWFANERGFFYTRYPGGGSYDQRVHRHDLGRDPAEDLTLFGEGRPREEMLALAASADGRALSIAAHEGWRRNDLFVVALDADARPLGMRAAAVGLDALYTASFSGSRLLVHTNEGAPNYRVFETAAAEPERAGWREIVPEREDVLDGVAVAGEALLLAYLHDVRTRLIALVRPAGAEDFAAATPVAIEGIGSNLVGMSGSESSEVAYLVDVDFFAPPAAKRLRLAASGARVETLDLDVAEEGARALVEPARYEVAQEWFRSGDGTRVPMFVLAKRGLPRDGSAPCVLYGYGGFNISLTPGFMPHLVPWLDAGGVYAIANLRGGGEFGEAWHRAGMRERKQTVFDDFIAALETLGERGIADPARIAISGGSNGGLLVSAVMVQRPDLLRAVHCAVPLCDMLRFHHFLIARLWIAEYGDPDEPNDAAFLRAYSPFHNVRDGERYPAAYFVTAESDSRVDPMHARKMAARVQAASASGAPALCYVESNAGHGAGKPRAKVVEELADRWSFFARELGVAL